MKSRYLLSFFILIYDFMHATETIVNLTMFASGGFIMMA